MYHGYDIVSSAAFRVTRNSNLYLAEEEARSLLESVRAELHNRRKGDAVRMEIEADADPEIIERLRATAEHIARTQDLDASITTSGTDERTGTGNCREMMAEHDPFVRPAEILAVIVNLARRRPAIIQRQHARGDPFGIKAITDGV